MQPETFEPRPNYWTALLWRRLMGRTVLDAGPSHEGMHLYAHCLRGRPGGIALLAINNSRTAESAIEVTAPSERYILAADQLQSRAVKLNDRALQLGADDALPEMVAAPQPAGRVSFAPATITYLAIPSAANPQCGAQ